MLRRSTPLALLLMLLTTSIAFAQTSAEFGRSSGEIDLKFKTPSRFSGSLGLTTGRSTFGTFGGTLVKDRVWFFAAGERTRTTQRFDGNALASIGDHNSAAMTIHAPDPVRPFLSLHYTGIVSSNSLFTAKVSSGQR